VRSKSCNAIDNPVGVLSARPNRRAARRNRAMHLILICLGILACPGRPFGASDDSFLLSAAISPDGTWVAENFGRDGCCDGGYVLIRKIFEPALAADAIIFSASPAPDLFLIWQNGTSLTLAQDANDEPVTGPAAYRGINLVYSTYQTRASDQHTFDSARLAKSAVSVSEASVSADASVERTASGRVCHLSLSVSDGSVYDKVGLDLSASINRCDRQIDCAGMNSRFWVGKKIDGRHGVALTSATVSDVPSYNRIPTGNRNSEVRGQFIAQSATDLLASVKSGVVDVHYSLNFFDEIVSYRIDTNRVFGAIESFGACIGDGDFNWIEHK
jgi:hypothetical protein